MFSRLKSCYAYLTGSASDLHAHASGESVLPGIGAFYLLGQFFDLILKSAWDMGQLENDYLKLSYPALGISAALTAGMIWGAYGCHKANDDGNAPELVKAFSTHNIELSLKKDVITLKQRLQCLGERGLHTLGYPGS